MREIAVRVTAVLGGSAAGLAGAGLLFALGPLALIPPVIGVVGGAVAGSLLGTSLRDRFQSRVDRDAAIVDALHAALRSVGMEPGPLQRDGDRIWADGPDGGRRFAEALATLLGPVRYPRLLIEADGTVWPVPDELGARQDLADAFVVLGRACRTLRDPLCAIGGGKALLRQAWKVGGHVPGRSRWWRRSRPSWRSGPLVPFCLTQCHCEARDLPRGRLHTAGSAGSTITRIRPSEMAVVVARSTSTGCSRSPSAQSHREFLPAGTWTVRAR